MPFDLNVRVSDVDALDPFVRMAMKLGFSGIAVGIKLDRPIVRLENGFLIVKRTQLNTESLTSAKKQIGHVRRKSGIVTVPLDNIQVSNWAAEDTRVDLLTITHNQGISLKHTTAKLASVSGTALEIPIAPLLLKNGLDRSKVIKVYRETARTAAGAGMRIVLTSGSNQPIFMRSSMAMRYIGLLLGLDFAFLGTVVNEIPDLIVKQNQRKLDDDFIAPGVEIVKEDAEE